MKNYIIRFFLVCFFVFYTSYGVFTFAKGYQVEAENVSNRNYFQAVLNAINNSQKSILIGMYIISLPSNVPLTHSARSVLAHERVSEEENIGGVRRLLDALINAKERGVLVKVILEYHRLEDFTPSGLNYNAYHYLKDNGIDVCFDESSTNCLHLKTIIIDKEIVIAGSSNWSEAAFKSSYETNFIIRSGPIAQEVTEELLAIPTRKEPPKIIADSFDIPSSFFDSRYGQLKRIIETNDLRSLDLVLLLWREKKDKVSCRFLAEKLHISDKMDDTGWRRQIKKSLNKLKERYRLINFEWQYGEDEIKIMFLPQTGSSSIRFPVDYYKYNWDEKLSLAGKAVLITMYAEKGELTDNISVLPILYLSKKYGITDGTYSKGIQELRRFNIIKVEYGSGFKNRDDTKINILGLYDMDLYNKRIEALNIQYGNKLAPFGRTSIGVTPSGASLSPLKGRQITPLNNSNPIVKEFQKGNSFTIDLVAEALLLAEIIYSTYDIVIVMDILEKINTYGIASVKGAFSYVKNMTPDNPKRTYNYVLGILRNRNKR